MPRALLGCTTAAIVLTASASFLSANAVSVRPSNTWTADGMVNTAVSDGAVAYVGGTFAVFGPRSGALTSVDRSTGMPLPWARFTGGSVQRVIRDAGAGYLVLGDFTAVDGVAASGIVRLDATGHLDRGFRWTFGVTPNAAFVAGDRLIVTAYQTAAPYSVSGFLDPRTGSLIAGPLPFQVAAAGTGPGGALLALVYQGGQSALVRLNPASGAIERALYTPPAAQRISAATISNSDVVVATTTFGAYVSPTGSVLRVDAATGTTTLLASVSGAFYGRISFPAVSSILRHNGRLFLQGNLTAVNGTGLPPSASGTAAIDELSGTLTEWRRPEWAVGGLLAADGDRLLFSAPFFNSSASPIGAAAALYALDVTTGAFTGWSLPLLADGSQAPVLGVVAETSRLLVGGRLAGVGTTPRRFLAAVSLPDGQPTSWAPTPAGPVFELALSGTRLFAVEGYTQQIVEYDTVTGVRGSWSAAPSGRIRRMAVAGNRLFVVGPFTAIDGLPRNGVASFDLTTSPPTLEPWTAPLGAMDVSAVYVLPSAVLVGGVFPEATGGPIHHLLALDPTSGAPLPWYPQVDDRIGQGFSSLDLAVTADRVYVSGFFDTVNGQPRPRVAVFDFGGRLLPWQLDDARDIAPSARLSLFEDRGYLTGFGIGQTLGVAFDLVSGRRVDWVPETDRSGLGSGGFAPAPGLGLLSYRAATGWASTGSYEFYPRIPSLPAVARLRATVNGSQVTLSWDSAAGAESYVIEAGSVPGLSNLVTIDTQSATTSYSTSAPNGRYYVRVRGRNEGGPGPVSNELVIVVGPGACAAPPDVPINLQGSVSGLRATLTWQAAPGGEIAARFAVDLVSGPGSPATIAQTSATTFSGSGPAGTYGVAVRAENACGSSAATAPVTLTLAATAR